MEQEEIMAQLKKHLSVWRTVAWVLLMLFAAAVTGLIILLFKEDKPKETPDTTPVVQNRFLDPEAEQHATQYTNHDCIVRVEKILGWQYITLEYENGMKISVRNEYAPEEAVGGELSALLVRGKDIRECRNDVSVDNIWQMTEKKPFLYGDAEYLFFANDDGTYGFINMNTLDEVASVNIQDIAASYFTLEGIGDDHVTVKAGNADFVFRSSVHKISFAGFKTTDEGHLLYISTPVCLGQNEFIGYLDGIIVPMGNRFALIEPKFGAYVGFNYEDPESTKIIEPSPEPLENPIVLSATGTGRYYLPNFTNVPYHKYNWANLEILENGYRVLKDDDGNVISKMGIDVSYHNNNKGAIDWKKVKNAGIDFAIIRVGYRGVSQGTVEEDNCAKENLRGAAEAGLDIGVYFYTQAVNEKEAVEEAEFLLKKIKEYGANVTLPVVIDTELYETKKTARGNLLTREQRTKNLVAFCERIESEGYTPMVYASTRWSILNYDRDALAKYPFWFAYYGEKVSYRYDFAIWQYTSEGTVPGIEGNVDLDIMLDFSVKK
ncbi:MAG: glycoside hydrolase family 25 protein [Lachnospiraceae bacterium]|nr:glycoside hydrolase family 25 protein [Lachnospiraceae bacterium]